MDFFSNIDLSRLWQLLQFDPQSPLIFSGGFFYIAFLIFLPLYFVVHRYKTLRIIYVVLFSLFFYYKCSGGYLILLLSATVWDYIIGQAMGRTMTDEQAPDQQPHLSEEERAKKNHKRRKCLLYTSITLNLGVLIFFKCFNVFGSLILQGLQSLGILLSIPQWAQMDCSLTNIMIPAGISFYTFQTMSYIIDIYRGDIKPLRRWIDYVFYVTFFPQLVAGPIVRAKDFIPQITRTPFVSKSEYSEALLLIISGLFKKAIISDYISLNFVDRVFSAPESYTGLENLFAIYAYAMQIYCDFSGYSDIAIGIALILGFRFNINFNSPYQSTSITEFWQRWHISLSSWLKDYLYIPLGGNRKGKIRTYINLILTMLIGGLWHGVAGRFLLWGGIHGVALALHKAYLQLTGQKGKSRPSVWPLRIIYGLLTFHLVCFAWIFFRAESMDIALTMIQRIYLAFHPEIFWAFIQGYWPVVALVLIGYILHMVSPSFEVRTRETVAQLPFLVQALLLLLVIFCVMQIRSAEVQPFIYFQF